MAKYIHYCWFGTKPLPKLAKKCIKSWQKYLPDYEIVKWSEENVNLDECPFVRGAYDNKKWAFVADYFRCKALKEMGGIYFDTDMEVTKDISKLLEDDTFLGIEDTGYVAVGVWYEKNKDAFLPNEMMKRYQNFKEFDVEKMGKISIPMVISDILKDYGLVKGSRKKQVLKNNIVIYPRDYFYPYSYGRDNNLFTDNTCMIHYYDASWIPLKDRIENNMVRKIGRDKTFKILGGYRKGKDVARKTAKVVLFPVLAYKKKRRKKRELKDQKYIDRINSTIELINKNKNSKYIVFYNKEWFGITSATKELFTNLVDCGEIKSKKDVKRIGEAILDSNIRQVVFSSFAIGWKDLVKYLHKNDKEMKLKTFWHGSHSQVLDDYGWARNKEIIELHKKGYIRTMATCKQSLEYFYERQKFNSVFLTNKVSIDKKVINTKPNSRKSKEIKIGIYAAKCDDWRKNMYTQIAAVSLIENAVIDMVPLNKNAIEFCNLLGVKLEGEEKPLPREELLKRMKNNDLNLYATYSECAPMLPLESMELGVVCLSGNNHHYFRNEKIEDYVIIKNESDVLEIKDKILKGIANKNKIIEMYKKVSNNNLRMANDETIKYLAK